MLLLLSACTLVGCAAIPADLVTAGLTPAKAPIFHERKGIFEIELPQGWVIAEQGELNEEAELEMKNRRDSMYIAALMENKEDLAMSFDEYAAQASKDLQEAYGVTLGEPARTTVGSRDARLFEFESEMDKTRFHMWSYAIETEHYYGRIMGWTLKSLADSNAEEIKRLVQTFKESSTPSTSR